MHASLGVSFDSHGHLETYVALGAEGIDKGSLRLVAVIEM